MSRSRARTAASVNAWTLATALVEYGLPSIVAVTCASLAFTHKWRGDEEKFFAHEELCPWIDPYDSARCELLENHKGPHKIRHYWRVNTNE